MTDAAQTIFERMMRCPFCMGGPDVCRGGHDDQIKELLRQYQAGHQDREHRR